jgi:hypothetical protein
MHFQVQGIGGLACAGVIIAPIISDRAKMTRKPRARIFLMYSPPFQLNESYPAKIIEFRIVQSINPWALLAAWEQGVEVYPD